MGKIKCNCGCVYETENDIDLSAELIECPMCFVYEEEDEEDEEAEDEDEGEESVDDIDELRIVKEHKKEAPKRKTKFSKINWTNEMLDYLKENGPNMPATELTKKLNKKFNTDIGNTSVWAKVTKEGIEKYDPKKKPDKKKEEFRDTSSKDYRTREYRSQRIVSEKVAEIIEEKHTNFNNEDLRLIISNKTGTFVPVEKIQEYIETLK